LPVYARLASASKEDLRAKVFKVRLALLSCALPPLCLLAVFGKQVIHILYDQRYVEAGWMIQILAIGTVGAVVNASVDCILLSVGDSFRHMLLQSAYALFLFSGLLIGAHFDGLAGILIGASAARLAAYIPMAALTRRYGVWLPKLDLAAFGLCAAFIFLTRHALHT
jgi:O-antigen/teichoic acid export membrane protein